MSNETGKTLKEAPKVGDRVTLPADYKGGGMWFLWLAGTSGRVTELEGSKATVKFDNGVEDHGRWTALMPENTPTAPEQAAPTHIVIEGVRYKLTPEPEDAPGEKRLAQQGEVWRSHQGHLLLVFCVGETGRLHVLNLSDSFTELEHEQSTFAYRSLAAAIKAGETFE